ncbi:MAG TPA: DUF2341 domain-containing protein [Bacteroidia bacterium]|nr:DUF2341 domain-containing protein [Bacteroidia bacterium]
MKKNYLILSSLFIFCTLAGFAQPAGWSYSLPLTITENSGSLVTDYQAKLIIDTQTPIGAGQMQTNGDDIRFGKDCAGNTLYNYWIESGINTTTTIIWVKIDTLFASSTRTFYMFYGNNAATPVSAVNGTFFGPQSSTDSVASGSAGGVGNSQRGFRFSPNEDILVTDFGKREPTGTTRYVTLFDFSTQAIVAQTQVSGPAAQYSYSGLANPVWLTTGTQYVLELYQGASDGYYFGTSSQIGQALTYYDMRYCNSCTQNSFPTNTLSNYQYGYPDLWYYTKNNVSPAPTVGTGTALSVNAGPDAAFCYGDSAMIGGTATGGNSPYVYAWSPATGISSPSSGTTYANPLSTTTYTLTVSDNTGCVSSDVVTVTVNPLPVVVATANQMSVCPGGQVILAASGASTYNWLPVNMTGATITDTPLSATTYSVIGTDVNGCTDTATQMVGVYTPPVVLATGTYASICDNAITTLTLSASGASTYSWMPISASGDTVTDLPSMSTTYTVVGTDVNSCTDTAYFSVTVMPSPVVAVTGSDSICAGSCTVLMATATGGTPSYSYSWAPSGNTTPTDTECPTASSCYTVTVADANGCADTQTVCNYVFPAPSVVSTGPPAVCAGDSATLNATGVNISSISWSPSTGLNTASGYTVVASPAATTTYTVVGTSSDGCSDTTTQLLTVNPLPSVSYTSSVDTVCATDPAFALSGGSPAGGVYSGPGVTGSNFSPSSGNGSHTITYTYTDANSCSASATHAIVVDPCTGIQSYQSTGGVTIFPNPFSTSFTISRETDENATALITDVNGKVVKTVQLNSSSTQISTEDLATGVYMIHIISDKGEQVFKLVREN